MTTQNRTFDRALFDRLCNERRLSRFRLAVAAGVSLATAQNAARGMVVGPGSRERLASALGTNADALWPVEQGG